MSVYNEQKYVKEAIESILSQTYRNYEFLIINDGSTDNTREIVNSYNDPRIRLIDNSSNMGLAKSLNRGLQISQGELIARQDADDISDPNRLERQVKYLDVHTDVMLLGTGVRTIDEFGKPHKVALTVPDTLTAIRWYLMFESAFAHTSVMFRRNIIYEKLGGYNEIFTRAQDYELWSRIARVYSVANLNETLVCHRFQYESTTKRMARKDPPIEDIAHENLKVFLKSPDITSQWASFIIPFQSRKKFSEFTDWKQAVEMYEQVWKRYCQLYPEAIFDQMTLSHYTANLYWLAYYSAPHFRRLSIQTYLSARNLLPKSCRHPSLLKYIALWFIGEKIRRKYKYLYNKK